MLTAKYAEGYPGRRYYGGCEIVDQVEDLAASAQRRSSAPSTPTSSRTPARRRTWPSTHALLERGDTVHGPRLDQGGHLTHGSPVNFSGQYYNFVAYKVDPETHLIDMDQVRALAREHRPKLIVDRRDRVPAAVGLRGFREIADEVGALLMTDMAHFAGLVAAGVHPSPIPHAEVVTTTTHKTLRGPRGGMILCWRISPRRSTRPCSPRSRAARSMHVIAGKAVAFERGDQRRVQARHGADRRPTRKRWRRGWLSAMGWSITGGTDNHLMLVDVRPLGVTGKEADAALGEVNITVNKNTIPYDPNPPAVGSGIRLGTPAVTSRGMVEAEMREIGDLIVDGVAARGNAIAQARVMERVATVADRFPVPGIPWTRERLGAAVAAGR